MTTTHKINAINIRMELLRARGTECGPIIKKLERKKRALQAKG